MVTCNSPRPAKPSGYVTIRLTGSDLGTVDESWRAAARKAVDEWRAAGYGLADLADELGVTPQYLSTVLGSRATLPVDTYLKLCKSLEIDPKAHVTHTTDTRLANRRNRKP